MNWYDKVSRDISNIPNAVAYYEAELIEAKQDERVDVAPKYFVLD